MTPAIVPFKSNRRYQVHPRTVAQKYQGPSRWSFLARLKREVGARTLLGSGDLKLEDIE
jgi:tRNA-dihydrouridine synthase